MTIDARRIAAATVVLTVGALAGTSCAGIAGIEGTYRGAVSSMCACDGLADAYGGDPTACADWFEERLASAKKSEVSAWLKTYVDLSCDLCTPSYAQTKLPCVHSPPFCSPDGGACSAALDCCNYPDSAACLGATVGNGVCGACRAVGETCATDEECCGYHDGNAFLGYDPPYCNRTTHVCVREPADCRRSFASCGIEGCCTGDIAAACEPNPVNPILQSCLELCDPTNPHNCPGCCAVTFFTLDDPNPVGICADGQPETCGIFCDVEGDPCGNGGTCKRTCGAQPDVILSYSRCYLSCVE